ncbi:MAG: hypothetical protein HFE78_06595 [Clostridiales bacterium]|nr:hypothetical protein [Clostridiales bacterium]
MNKKYGAFLLAILCCLFAFASCSEQADAYQLYLDMNKAMENTTSMKATMDGNMQMSVSGESLELQLKSEITAIEYSEEQTDAAMTMEISLAQLGSVNTSIYVKDGYVYQDVMGMKIKTEMESEEISELTYAHEAGVSLDFAKDAVIESSVKKVDGGKELAFRLDGQKVTDELETITEAITSQLGNNINITFGDVAYTLLVGKDSLPIREELTFSFDLTIEGERASASYTLTMTDIDYNVTQIDYPADLDSYQLIDASFDGLSA